MSKLKTQSKVVNSEVKHCSCANEGQDTLYGKGNRVHNRCEKSGSQPGSPKYRCTVCKAVK